MAENGSPEQKPNLDAKQQRALNALIKVGNVIKAAKLARVPERTLYRWLEDEPAFKKAMQTASDNAISAAGLALTDAATEAVSVLRSIMQNQKVRREDSVRVRAAGTILQNTLRWKEQSGILERLARLEAVLAKGKEKK